MADHVCPVWIAHILANPLRKWLQNPEKILKPHVREGMTVLDMGCAMGFFSLPMAKLTGKSGSVLCVDLQEKMLQSLEKRARKTGLNDIIKPHLCSKTSLNLDKYREQIDFVFAYAVVHEIPDSPRLFLEIHDVLKHGGRCLVAEPRGHVSKTDFTRMISMAVKAGFIVIKQTAVCTGREVLLEKNHTGLHSPE
jgi:ubiquinone/menaquinone biosynthesis C-methylase UbiE